MRYDVPLLIPTMLFLLTSHERDPCAVSEVTYVGFVSSVLLPVSERPPILERSPTALRKSKQLVSLAVPLFVLTPAEWEEKFLQTSMACNTMKAYEYVRQIDRFRKIADFANHKCRKLQQPYYATRFKNVILPYQSTNELPKFWDFSVDTRSRPGFAVGILRLLCNGLCTTKRFHVVNDDQTRSAV